MTRYDELKKKHKNCKDEMSSRDWKKFSIDGIPDKCPICHRS